MFGLRCLCLESARDIARIGIEYNILIDLAYFCQTIFALEYAQLRFAKIGMLIRAY